MANKNDAIYSQKLYLLALKGQITVEYLDGHTLAGEFLTQDTLNIFVRVDNTPLLIPRSQVRAIKGKPGQSIEEDSIQTVQPAATTISAPAVEVSESEPDDTLNLDPIEELDETDQTIVLPEERLVTGEVQAAAKPVSVDSPGTGLDEEAEDFTMIIRQKEPAFEEQDEMTYVLSETGITADIGTDTHEVAAYLDCITGPHAGEVFKLMPGITTIGRSNDNVLALSKDKEISRKHTKITYEGGHFVAEDQGSLNGTFVNNERIEGPRYLDDGDVVMVGVSTLIYHKQ